MSGKNILINGLTLEEATIIPLLLNARYWQSQGCSVDFLGNADLKRKIDEARIIDHFGFSEIKNTRKISTKLNFILEGINRNLSALFYLDKIKGLYDIVYSRSSVLDLIIFPHILKRADKRIKWFTVFDNIVPFFDPGNKFFRFLAWSFFQFSLLLLKSTDKIFAISDDLRNFLIRKGIKENKIVLTGNGVEADTIRSSHKDARCNIDALFIGRINETKGIYDLLKVLVIVKEKYPGFQLAIMGRGDKKTEINFKNKIKKLSLEENIRFLGYKIGLEKFNIIKSSKCFWFLSVSESESFGIALLEAVCCGLPAFVYDLKPYKNIYKNNEVMIFPKYDFKSVAMKVIELFEKGEFNNKRGELLLDKYSWDKIAEIEFNSFNNL